MARAADSRTKRLHFAALALVAVVGAALVIYKVRIAIAVGPGWDTYAFLANAAEFAGKGFGYTEPHRAPFMSLITSLIFRFGALDQATIQWVDGALSFSGLIAFFLLMRKRFDVLPSVVGALGLLVAQPLWDYLGVGYTDFASIALSAWLLLSVIAATEKHAAWYLMAGALYVAAIMTRYTALLFLFPTIVYLLMRWRPFRQAGWLFGAVGTAIATYLPAAYYYATRFGDVMFPFLIALGFSETVASPAGEGQATAAGGWYLTQLPSFLAPAEFEVLALLALAIGILGLLRITGDYIGSCSFTPRRVLLALGGVGVAVLGQLAGGLFARQLSIPLAALMIWSALAPREESVDGLPPRISYTAAIDAAMLTWFLTYLDFHGHQTIQVPRYFITMAPSVIYFTVLGWSGWATVLTDLRQTLDKGEQPSAGIRRVIMLVLAGLVAVLLVATAMTTPREPDRYVAASAESSAAMALRDSRIADKTIYSDVWPLIAWYLQTNVRPMPSFEDPRGYDHELEKSEADYFFTIRGRRFDAYTDALTVDSLVVLKRRPGATTTALPSVQYLGKSWDNYLESTTDFDFFLQSTAGRYGWEGSSFLDAHTAKELAASDVVAAYGWRWQNRAAAEEILSDYVEQGGTVIIDASQNLDGLAYSVAGTIMFDTFIRPGTVAPNADIEVRGALAAAHPRLARIDASPFVDETGGAWSGATYESRPGTPALSTLATVGGLPAIQSKRIGQGTVYFVSYNLVWHAFSTENAQERELIAAFFDEAINGGSQ